MADICTDNRFEVIEEYKQKLIECTNIETAQDEMAVIDNILFRFWQMGWLPSAQPDWGKPAGNGRPLADSEIIPRLQDIKIQIGGSYAIDRAIEVLERLSSAQPEQRWIPWDSGKFPEESGTYNVTAYDGVTNRVTHAKYQKRLKRWELTGSRAYWRVLAWIPLPEPYNPDDFSQHMNPPED